MDNPTDPHPFIALIIMPSVLKVDEPPQYFLQVIAYLITSVH